MPAKRFAITAVLALTTAALACSTAAPATVTPTATAAPSQTVLPTASPAPSSTPLPSATATTAATPTAAATGTPAATAAPTATTGPTVLKIVSDLALFGDSSDSTQGMVNAERMRITEARFQACDGRYSLEFEDWNDSSFLNINGDQTVEAANATRAAADPAVIAYLGPFQSAQARAAIPILAQSGPLVMISPGSTVPSLTKPDYANQGEPNNLYPAGLRNFARVVSTWEVEGTVSARLAHDQFGSKSAYILDDGSVYGQQLADAFAAEAGKLGLTVAGRSSFDTGTDLAALMQTVAASNQGKAPDTIFLSATPDDPTPAVVKAKVAALGNNQRVRLIGPGALSTTDFVQQAGAAAEGMYFTLYGLPSAQYLTAGSNYWRKYKQVYGVTPDFYAIYGYEAMNVVLQAIEDVCLHGGNPTQRAAVRDAVFALRNFAGALGRWSFDANGDTSLTDMTFYIVKASKFVIAAFSQADAISVAK